MAALRAVLVVLPLLGGKTALLLGTCSVPLAVCWVLGQAFTGGFLATSFWSAILTNTKTAGKTLGRLKKSDGFLVKLAAVLAWVKRSSSV